MSVRKAFLLSVILGATGCAHSVHEVHTSDFSPARPIEQGEMVSAKTEQFVVLGFAQETDYVDQAYRKLLQECPNGSITGITTQYSTSLGFFSWTNKILMQGLCLSGAKNG